jgi:hydrogenase expression/formation protein HypC
VCWATPARIVGLDRERGLAVVEPPDGGRFEAVVAIDPDELREGDLVLVHAGMVISRLEEEADRLELIARMVEELEKTL